MPTAIDLFAGLGGWSTGARTAAVQVLWAANHWPIAVEWHSANHPHAQHAYLDLHQAGSMTHPKLLRAEQESVCVSYKPIRTYRSAKTKSIPNGVV